MTRYFLVFLFPVFFAVLNGCGKEITKDMNTNMPRKESYKMPANISPGYCRITGTIISIDSTLETGNKNSPCAKAPCTAVVKIDSVWGYGSDFPPLNTRKPITLKFKFTLGPTTKDLFPNMSEFYPGLKAGDTFVGDIHKAAEETGYSIFGYHKK